MRRRTLDVLFSVGGVGIAILLLVLGMVFKSEADFATQYVRDQLSEQAIYFAPVEALSEEERQVPCLVEYGTGDQAARQLLTGSQAECYANEFIGRHLRAATGGLSYAELGTPQREARAAVAEARETNDPALPELEAELARIDAQRNTAFQGETLRGLLLTTYGFSLLGEKAALAASIAFIGAALMLLLSIAGFIHAARTPKDVAFAPPVKD